MVSLLRFYVIYKSNFLICFLIVPKHYELIEVRYFKTDITNYRTFFERLALEASIPCLIYKGKCNLKLLKYTSMFCALKNALFYNTLGTLKRGVVWPPQ